MSDAPTIEELARGLTEAQRDRIITAPHADWFSVSWEGWKGLIWSLQTKGLTAPREPGLQVLTPLGLTLRAYLETTHER